MVDTLRVHVVRREHNSSVGRWRVRLVIVTSGNGRKTVFLFWCWGRWSFPRVCWRRLCHLPRGLSLGCRLRRWCYTCSDTYSDSNGGAGTGAHCRCTARFKGGLILLRGLEAPDEAVLCNLVLRFTLQISCLVLGPDDLACAARDAKLGPVRAERFPRVVPCSDLRRL